LTTVADNPVLPNFTSITGTEDFASGHALNAFRQSAARYFGMYATPAPFFTISSRGCSTYKVKGEYFTLPLPQSNSPKSDLPSGFDTVSLAVPPPLFICTSTRVDA